MKISSKQIAVISIIIVSLALIRCIGEFFRLQYIHRDTLTIETVQPFMVGAMVCAVSCLLMNILFFYSRFIVTTAFAIVTIIILFLLKFYYHL